jgi:hypothetical protein
MDKLPRGTRLKRGIFDRIAGLTLRPSLVSTVRRRIFPANILSLVRFC